MKAPPHDPQKASPATLTRGKRLAAVQSCYIPWKGYFDLINCSDEFILYDDMQYTRRDWRNRNLIKTAQGVRWLSVPVQVKGQFLQKIKDTKISDPGWAKEHWLTILHTYSRAKRFKDYRDQFEQLYLDCREEYLSQINHRFISAICGILGIRTKLTWSSAYSLSGDKTEKLVDICRQAGAAEYLSGPSAKDYIEPQVFDRDGLALTFMDYSGYPEYDQLYPPFEHRVSVLDLIFNEGAEASRFMKSFAAAGTR